MAMIGAAGNMRVGLRAVRIRRGAHALVELPPGTVTTGSLAELPGVRVLLRV